MSKQGRVGSGISYGKGETEGKSKSTSSSVEGGKQQRQEDMTRLEKYMFVLAATALLVAVCVAPLAAEASASGSTHHKHRVLKMDEAFLRVNNELGTEVVVSWVSERCYQCLYQQLGVVPAAPTPGQPSSVDFVVSTQHEITLQLNSTPVNLELCTVPFHFGEHGNYSLWVKNFTDSSVVNCSVVTDADPINSYIPILVAFLIFAGLILMSCIGRIILRLDVVRNILFRVTGSLETERLINSELGSPGRAVPPVSDTILPPPPNPSKRLRSLDTFRGIALVIMVFVNYGGGRYWFFRHQSWNGLTVADLVFPWFVFIMGTSIALSTNSLLCAGSTRCSLLRKTVWRSLQLFILGVVIINPNYCQGPLSWDNLRIPGVLQRLAWSYLVVACLDLLVAKGHLDILTTSAWWSPFRDILLYWPAWLCVILLEILWLFLTFQLPVADCPAGYLGPGGIGDMGLYMNCTGGAAGFIDRWLLGENHIYQTPSSRVIYATRMPFDPEGVLGSINSVLMAFLGLQAGKIILHYRDLHTSIMSRFLLWGLFLGAISAILTKCSTDQGFIPVNKNLWSLSYVTTLACFAFVLLVLLYFIVDVQRWWSGAPFYYPGMNSILVYVGHEVLEEYFPFRWRMANSQSHAEHLTQNLVATSCWVFIAYVLYRKRIFWKI
ncbi:heparan-alpha-glucosaminide N-acetyltransferase isoform X1 [Hippoglossus stenolepis]|uniref:heparan-alpha-glucosaminide N-acetyltransferase isoform X1 n=2 Tax=Hippoglossus stenolepis TaxID=195615 RepID=UPI001FAFAF14|nr:heparan-alpha-glucosaminide N-acetyltransferase isoform X1 [Hippoglossus stenolepis]